MRAPDPGVGGALPGLLEDFLKRRQVDRLGSFLPLEAGRALLEGGEAGCGGLESLAEHCHFQGTLASLRTRLGELRMDRGALGSGLLNLVPQVRLGHLAHTACIRVRH